jgi:hypothetical protein
MRIVFLALGDLQLVAAVDGRRQSALDPRRGAGREELILGEQVERPAARAGEEVRQRVHLIRLGLGKVPVRRGLDHRV